MFGTEETKCCWRAMKPQSHNYISRKLAVTICMTTSMGNKHSPLVKCGYIYEVVGDFDQPTSHSGGSKFGYEFLSQWTFIWVVQQTHWGSNAPERPPVWHIAIESHSVHLQRQSRWTELSINVTWSAVLWSGSQLHCQCNVLHWGICLNVLQGSRLMYSSMITLTTHL